ncbi:MAG: hypothetical protein WCB01_11465 [Candidatus Cybelea sp.]
MARSTALRIGAASLHLPRPSPRVGQMNGKKRRISKRKSHGLAKIERMNDVDGVFRAQMRTLARRGGAATKRGAEPNYYRTIGRLGGEASVAARKRRIYAELDGGVCEPLTVPPSVPLPTQPPPSSPQTKRHLTLSDILGEDVMLSLAFGPASSRSSRR